MKIPNYRPPRHELEQDFAEEASGSLDRNNLIVVGPAYQHADSLTGNLVEDAYAGGAELGFRRLVDGASVAKPVSYEIDAPWVTLEASDLWLTLYTKGAAGNTAANNAFNLYPLDRTGRVLHYKTAGNSGFLNTDSAAAALAFDGGRSIQAGDILKITGDSGTVHRKVVDLAGVDVAGSISGYGYYGAAKLTTAGSPNIYGVVHSAGTVAAANIDLDISSLAGDDLLDWARAYGSIAAAATCTR